MGCWGITAMESDIGLDALICIREHLRLDGKASLTELLEALKDDAWSCPEEISSGASHSSPMMLAEIVVKFLDGDLKGLDYEDDSLNKAKRFGAITSFQASRESIAWIRTYLNDTLQFAQEEAKPGNPEGRRWAGWLKEEDWNAWQEHMKNLIGRMDELLVLKEDVVELIQPQETMQEAGMQM